MLSFGGSWGPVPWALPSEIFPSSLRAKGVALSTCSNWLNNFIIVSWRMMSMWASADILPQGLTTPPLVQNTGFGAYTFFAVFCLLSLIWTFYFVPETRGRTLEQMDHIFKDVASEQEETRRRNIELDIIGGTYEISGEQRNKNLPSKAWSKENLSNVMYTPTLSVRKASS